MHNLTSRIVLSLTTFAFAAQLHAKPLKVFILAGQSNMEGPAKIETFDYIGDDPATASLLKQMRGSDGKPRVCDGAWISYLTGANEKNFEITGKLTAGYGSMWGLDSTKPGDKIGPEFTFGLAMDAAFQEPVLIIKAAWGGKSLHTDFRPPSAGPYVFNETQLANIAKRGKDLAEAKAKKATETGVYYRLMVEHVKRVLGNIHRVVPEYDAAQGYEIAGFAWLQGWNDLVDGDVYPQRQKPGGYAAYSEVMAHFIRDVRKEFNAPKMPFVIGVLGVGGAKAGQDVVNFRTAMAAPALLPEFKGNVAVVKTDVFWDTAAEAVFKKGWQNHKDEWDKVGSDAIYHYLGSAKTNCQIGRAFGEAMIELRRSAAKN